jgi:hypothetical protein
MYVIVKHVNFGKDKDGMELIRPVILVDSHSEILEFNSKEEAEKTKNLFVNNSTHGSVYEVKEL